MNISAKNKRVVDVDGVMFDTQREAFIHIMRKTFSRNDFIIFSEMWKHRRAIKKTIDVFEEYKFCASYDAPPTGDENSVPEINPSVIGRNAQCDTPDNPMEEHHVTAPDDTLSTAGPHPQNGGPALQDIQDGREDYAHGLSGRAA